jgi:hypothetical protein
MQPTSFTGGTSMQFGRAARLSAATGAAALLAVSLSAPTASAVETMGTPQQIKTKGGSALFYDINENLEARDLRADGYGARAYLAWKGHRAMAYTNGGKGSRAVVDLNIAEGTTVYLQLCYTDKGRNVKSSKLQKGVA